MKTFVITLLLLSSAFAEAQKFTFVFLNKKPDAEKPSEGASKQIMEGHMANINRLASEGKLIAARPLKGAVGFLFLQQLRLTKLHNG